MSKKTIKKRDPGRPTEYTPERGAAICALYASGTSEVRIARLKGYPAKSTMQKWRKDHGEFALEWAEARKAKAEYHAQQGLDALTELSDKDLIKLGRAASAAVSPRDKRANYHKWLAGVLDRAGYGDKLQVDMDVRNQTLVAFVDMAPKSESERAQMDAPYILPPVVVPDGSTGR